MPDLDALVVFDVAFLQWGVYVKKWQGRSVVNGVKQRRVLGDLVRIELGDGTHSYARVLPEATLAFYAVKVNRDVSIDAIVENPIVFIIAVVDYAIKAGRWGVVGNVPLSRSNLRIPPRFIQDSLDPYLFSIYENGLIRPAAREECVGIECAAVWEPEHVEDRLRDHFAGRPNKWVQA